MQFPTQFIDSIPSFLGGEKDDFLSALLNDAPVSIRLNKTKAERNPMQFSRKTERVPWSDCGYYLENRPAFTFDPLFHSGYYYVQEASSMFIEHAVRELVKGPAVCLDVCAAPGGKSISLLSALPHDSLLVSNEIIRQRANVLAETMIKFGQSNVVVTNSAPNDFAASPAVFDVVLVDAPCSGEGMFRKDETAVAEWSPQNMAMCTARQKDILRDVWPALKPGGILIYSTCTFNVHENEENALWVSRELGAEFISVNIPAEWGISPSAHSDAVGYRFFPHKTKGEGLFVTILRKTTVQESMRLQAKKKKGKSRPFLKDLSMYESFLCNPQSFNFAEIRNRVVALPKIHSHEILFFNEKFKVLYSGLEMGENKGNNFIPSHALAMSVELHRGAFVTVEITYEQAISYLRKEAILLPDVPKGWVLLTYKNEPLGFVKNVGNRANNLYPAEWRIRSGYLPDFAPNFLTPAQ